MYMKIITKLNNFLTQLNIPAPPVNAAVFDSVFIKKLSNQNIVKDKRRIKAGETTSAVNQTHLDITGQKGMQFFL